jgi:hypothetical protein
LEVIAAPQRKAQKETQGPSPASPNEMSLNLPFFLLLTRKVRVDLFLLTHKIVEKVLLDELRVHYLYAHQVAVRAERDAVKAADVSWWVYQRFMKNTRSRISEERLACVPSNLDLTPYRDEKDFGVLRQLVRNAGKD